MSTPPDHSTDSDRKDAEDGLSAEDGELTVRYQRGLDEGPDITRPLPQLLTKHQIATRIDLGTTPEVDTLLPSQHLEGGRYEVVELLAKGGMGVVFRSTDRDLRRRVAMKVITPKRSQDSESMIRFIEEAQITGQLEHPNIVPVHELGVDGNENLFYTMKLIRGHNLKEVLDGIRKQRSEILEKYSLSHLLNIFLKVCDAVAFAHSKGIVHRDLKPENIMIGDFGEVLVLDWGIAKILPPDHDETDSYGVWDGANQTKRAMSKVLARRRPAEPPEETDEASTRHKVDSIRMDEDVDISKTQDGLILGSPAYMAPEQAFGDVKEIDRRTDIYSLGAILFSILTLRKYLEGKNIDEISTAMMSGELRSPIAFAQKKANESKELELPHCPAGRIPQALSDVVAKAMQTWKRDRYQEVAHLQDDILAYLGGYATTAESLSPLRKGLLFVRRHKFIFTGLAVALGLIIAAAFPAVRAILDLKDRLDTANASVATADNERDQLQRQLDYLKKSRVEALAAAEDLAQAVEKWQWEEADAKARQLMANDDYSALLLPPRQLMGMAQIQLFHGDIDTALLLLQLLPNSPSSAASREIVAELTQGPNQAIPPPTRTPEWLGLSRRIRRLDSEEARLSADCLLAGAILTSLEKDRSKAHALAIELMQQSSSHPGSFQVSFGTDDDATMTLTQAEPGTFRWEILNWLEVAHLDLSACPELDVTALRDLPSLKTVRLPATATGLEALRELELQRIGLEELLPPEEFWRQQGF